MVAFATEAEGRTIRVVLGFVVPDGAELVAEEVAAVAAAAIIRGATHARAIRVLRILNLIEHKVLDQVDGAAALETRSTTGAIIVPLIGGAIGAVARPCNDRASASPPLLVLLDDVVWTGHATDGRWHLGKQLVQNTLSETVHVPVVAIEDLPILGRVVYLISRHRLLIDEALELV